MAGWQQPAMFIGRLIVTWIRLRRHSTAHALGGCVQPDARPQQVPAIEHDTEAFHLSTLLGSQRRQRFLAIRRILVAQLRQPAARRLPLALPKKRCLELSSLNKCGSLERFKVPDTFFWAKPLPLVHGILLDIAGLSRLAVKPWRLRSV